MYDHICIAVEDHPLVVDSLRDLVHRLYPAAHFESYDNVEMLLKKDRFGKVDFIFYDLLLNGVLSFNALSNIRRMYPTCKILVLSSFDDEMYANKVMEIGVEGFINKREPIEYLENAVKVIMTGGTCFKRSALTQSRYPTEAGKLPQTKSPFKALSNREFEICILLMEGFEIPHIASALNISRSTVSSHKMKLLEKLQVKNVIQLKTLANTYNVACI